MYVVLYKRYTAFWCGVVRAGLNLINTMSRIIETEVFTFDELSEEAKEVARQWYREGNDYPFLSEFMDIKAGELLLDAKISGEHKVFYSLGYCQGDGAMVELTGDWKAWHVSVKHAGHYYHERSTTITLESRRTGQPAPVATIERFQEEVYVPLCKALRDFGYECIEDENSNESVDETIRANEYEFTSDGKRF